MDKLQKYLQVDLKLDFNVGEENYKNGTYERFEYVSHADTYNQRQNKNKVGYLYHKFLFDFKTGHYPLEYGYEIFFVDDDRTHYDRDVNIVMKYDDKEYKFLDDFLDDVNMTDVEKDKVRESVKILSNKFAFIINKSFRQALENKINH